MNKAIKIIVFSRDRPTQLCAMLESFFLNCDDANLAEIDISYRPSEDSKLEYLQVADIFSKRCNFIKRADFNADLKTLIEANKCKYISFLVDDIIFKEKFSILDCSDFMSSNEKCFTLSLRMGIGIDYCYSSSSAQKQPQFLKSGQFLKYRHGDGTHDWDYPFSIDGNIYRTDELNDILKDIPDFRSPNFFESQLAAKKNLVVGREIACFETPKLFNIPDNIVQKDFKNRSESNSYMRLIELWRQGLKIDVSVYQGIKNNACHFPVDYQLIRR